MRLDPRGLWDTRPVRVRLVPFLDLQGERDEEKSEVRTPTSREIRGASPPHHKGESVMVSWKSSDGGCITQVFYCGGLLTRVTFVIRLEPAEST